MLTPNSRACKQVSKYTAISGRRKLRGINGVRRGPGLKQALRMQHEPTIWRDMTIVRQLQTTSGSSLRALLAECSPLVDDNRPLSAAEYANVFRLLITEHWRIQLADDSFLLYRLSKTVRLFSCSLVESKPEVPSGSIFVFFSASCGRSNMTISTGFRTRKMSATRHCEVRVKHFPNICEIEGAGDCSYEALSRFLAGFSRERLRKLQSQAAYC